MTIASLLKENGYKTAMIGKWHLQMKFAGTLGKNRDWSKPFSDGPIEKGFDYYFEKRGNVSRPKLILTVILLTNQNHSKLCKKNTGSEPSGTFLTKTEP